MSKRQITYLCHVGGRNVEFHGVDANIWWSFHDGFLSFSLPNSVREGVGTKEVGKKYNICNDSEHVEVRRVWMGAAAEVACSTMTEVVESQIRGSTGGNVRYGEKDQHFTRIA